MLKKRLGILAASLVVVLSSITGLQLLTPAPATAVGCSGASCTGKDPEVQGCGADAKTVDSYLGHYRNNIGKHTYVELRHSSACRARWLRVTTEPSDWGCGGGSPLHIRLRDVTTGGGVIAERIKTFGACEGQFFTAMVGRTASSARTQFCFKESAQRDGAWGTDDYYSPCKSPAWP